MPRQHFTRRTFIKTTAAALAALSATGSRLFAASRDKLNIGVIGVQGQGWWNITQIRHENIVALCDVDADRLVKSRMEFPDAVAYADYRILLEKQKDIDAVLVATPDHSHAPASCLAMRSSRTSSGKALKRRA